MTYREYLKSAHWQSLRERKKTRDADRRKCLICKETQSLHLHHKTYKRLGKEYLGDVIWLCKDCHYLVHQIMKKRPTKAMRLWRVANTLRKRLRKIIQRKYWNKGLKSPTPEIQRQLLQTLATARND
jgi:5-methylcytosine-specific restriction endonuclease McrA